jgi:hypothetical protein
MIGIEYSADGEGLSVPVTIDSSHLIDGTSASMGHTSNSSQIIIDCSNPEAIILNPGSGEEFFEMPEITVQFKDNYNINRGYYQIDDCDGDWIELWQYNSNSPDTTFTWTIPQVTFGEHQLYFKITDDLQQVNPDSCSFSWDFTFSGYICGDANHDNFVNVSDAVYIINYIFVGGNPPNPMAAGNVNCDIGVNVSDAVWIINYIFIGGNEPCDWDDDGIPDC